MRVVAGELGGRRLIAPAGTSTRPTTDRVREAIFNSLGSAGLLDGALVADLFAGSGAIGIEALSRGAERCVFVERDRTAFLRELRLRAGQQVHQLARRVIGKLCRASLEQQVIDAFVEQLQQLDENKRREIAAAIRNAHHKVLVETA